MGKVKMMLQINEVIINADNILKIEKSSHMYKDYCIDISWGYKDTYISFYSALERDAAFDKISKALIDEKI